MSHLFEQFIKEGHEMERYKYEELVMPCLIIAWINIGGALLYWAVTSLFFSN